MASQQGTVDFILEQIAGAGAVSARKMFGEYGVYCDGKMVALVADDKLFVKPTEPGRAHIGEVDEAPPYPGAKPCFRIAGDMWDDADWLTALMKLTTAALPAPAPKRKAKSA
jgi:TfoX/Sxy family transcriptional regulator of competence genes